MTVRYYRDAEDFKYTHNSQKTSGADHVDAAHTFHRKYRLTSKPLIANFHYKLSEAQFKLSQSLYNADRCFFQVINHFFI